jgi:hypothetical protein
MQPPMATKISVAAMMVGLACGRCCWRLSRDQRRTVRDG